MHNGCIQKHITKNVAERFNLVDHDYCENKNNNILKSKNLDDSEKISDNLNVDVHTKIRTRT